MVGQLRQPLQTRSEVAVGSEDSNSLSPHVVSGMQSWAETRPVDCSTHLKWAPNRSQHRIASPNQHPTSMGTK